MERSKRTHRSVGLSLLIERAANAPVGGRPSNYAVSPRRNDVGHARTQLPRPVVDPNRTHDLRLFETATEQLTSPAEEYGRALDARPDAWTKACPSGEADRRAASDTLVRQVVGTRHLAASGTFPKPNTTRAAGRMARPVPDSASDAPPQAGR
jgi:hypothetical protein